MENQIICGNCIEIMRDIPDESIDLIIADPPYMVSQEGKKINRAKTISKSWNRKSSIDFDFGEWDLFPDEETYKAFTENWFRECTRILKPKAWIYIFFDKNKTGYFDLDFAPKYNIKPRTIFIWIKSNPTPSFRKVNWLSATEHIWVGSKGKSKIKNFLQQKEMVNYLITPNKTVYGKTSHPTEKPEELIEKFMITSSNRGDLVLDPFLGSGTTAVVAKKLDRNFIGIEIDENFCAMARQRLSVIPEKLFYWP